MQIPPLETNLLLLPTNQLLQLAVGAAGSLTLPVDLGFAAGLCPGTSLPAPRTRPFGAAAGRLSCSSSLAVINSSTLDAALQ